MGIKATNGKEIVYELMRVYCEREKENILRCLTDDIIWVGTAAHEQKFGKEEVSRLLDDDLLADDTPYDVEFMELREVVLNSHISTIFAVTKSWQRGNTDFVMECRHTFTCCDTEEGFKICSWHGSLATALQTEDEYFPLSFADNILKKARMDALTQTMNRATFEESIQGYLQEEQDGFAFILIDLDNFKFVNDHFGHISGDEVLVHIADRLKVVFAQIGLVARLGGDEFVAFIPHLGENGEKEVEEKINEFIQRISVNMYFNAQQYTPSASVGVYICKENLGLSYEQCYKAADAAMYEAKNRGKSTWHIKPAK